MLKGGKLYLNTISSLINQGLTILSGFILPKLILNAYGSDVNGMLSSISQFVSFISFMQLGIGAVVQSAWYKPLALKDSDTISAIYKSANSFFKKIAYVLILYTIVLCVVFPIFFAETMDPTFVVLLIVAVSINLFSQYYLGITNQLLLFADQKAYVHLFSQSILIVINLLVTTSLICSDFSIVWVKMTSSLIYSMSPLFLAFYVRKNYKINKDIQYSEEPIKQKWNGFAQHLSSVIMENTDVIILTLFSSFNNISVYSVYHLVVNGIKQLVISLTVGVQSKLGQLVTTSQDKLKHFFAKTEIIFHAFVTIMFSCTIVLICPFVELYTKGISDADYYQPVFALIISLAFACYCYRLPYYATIKAYGHYKETQLSAIIEMLINVVISVAVVIKFGLVGVAIGTFLANFYRTGYFIIYLRKNTNTIVIVQTIKLLIDDILVLGASIVCSMFFLNMKMNILQWILLGIACVFIFSMLYYLVLVIMFPTKARIILNTFISKIRRKKNNVSLH